ncbi:substrate-binding periplasmic protein [Cysteiniphilum marinum]|uniref:substrate-binding periplasmic protein n=2 Tax=Fastidiosibacteraceae TaxID=2056687 RepID=UPI00193A0FBA|nr:transporter substrate-binding domain-containing protein [Cysteiniphilum marinum]
MHFGWIAFMLRASVLRINNAKEECDVRGLKFSVILLSMSMSYASAQTQYTVDYALGDYYYPYVNQHEDNKGCLTEFVTKVFNSQGVKLGEIKWLPWSVAIKSLAYGASPSVSFPWSYTKKRAQKYLYSDALYTKSAYIWMLTDNKQSHTDFKSLQGAKVCVPQGYGAYGKLAEMFAQKTATRITALTMQDCFSQLKAKRVTAVYAGNDALENIAHIKDGISLFTKAFVADQQTHYLIAAKDQTGSAKLISLFNNGLKTMKFNPDLYCGFDEQ